MGSPSGKSRENREKIDRFHRTRSIAAVCLPVVAIDGHFQLRYGVVVRHDVSRQCPHADGLQRVITRGNSVSYLGEEFVSNSVCENANADARFESASDSPGLNVVADWSCTLTGRRSSPTLRSTTVTGTSCASVGRVSAVPGACPSTGYSKTVVSVWPREPSCEVIMNYQELFPYV